MNLVCRLLLAGVLWWTLVGKLDAVAVAREGFLRGPFAFADAIGRHGVVPQGLTIPAAFLVFAAEILLIVWLTLGTRPRQAAIVTLAFLAIVTAYLAAVAALGGAGLSCGCAGIGALSVGAAIWRNIGLGAIAGVAVATSGDAAPRSARKETPRHERATAGS